MDKKLFIIGAGASKDIDNKMPLNKDIILKIKNLKYKLYLELLSLAITKLVYINTKKSYIIGMGSSSLLQAENIIKQENSKQFKHLKRILNLEEVYKLPEIKSNLFIKKFLGNLLYNLQPVYKSKNKNTKLIDKIYKYLTYDKFEAVNCSISKYSLSFALAKICTFDFLNGNIYAHEEHMLVNINIFLNTVINFIAEPTLQEEFINQDLIDLLQKIKSLIKNYILNNLILCRIVENYNENIYSIDFLINFASNTIYVDEYSRSFNLPNKEQLKKFTLSVIGDYIFNSSINVNITNSWITYIEKIALENDIDFINFNYDNFIENYINLKNKLKDFYSKDQYKLLDNLLEKITNSHMYGHVNKSNKIFRHLTGATKTTLLENIIYNVYNVWNKRYGTELLQEIIEYENIKELSNKIKLIRIYQDQNNIQQTKQKLLESDQIYILGFGFDKWNLKNLGLYNNKNPIKGKTIYITNYGNFPKIRLIIEEIFNVRLYKEDEIEEQITNEEITKNIKYSFWRSHKDDQNKVFVSTKPVYRALNEDFNL